MADLSQTQEAGRADAQPDPTQPLAAATEQTQHLVQASIRTWAEESQAFIDEMAHDSAEAMQALQGCASPIEVIAVEQRYLLARTGAYVEAGWRALLGAVVQPEEAAAECGVFVMPD